MGSYTSKMLNKNHKWQRVEVQNRYKEQGQQIEIVTNVVNINPIILIITFNINIPNAPVTRQRPSDWIKKQDPMVHYLQETFFKYKGM